MKYTPADTGFPSGIPTWKRRYSSTAVEFPIRNDQKPHSHGLSGVFPSWVRAHRTPTYVHTRTKSAPSPENQQPYCQTSTMIVLNNDATSTRKYPLWRCIKTRQTLICTSLIPRQLHVCTSIVPYLLLDCNLNCAQMILIYTSLAPRQHLICSSIVPCVLLVCTLNCAQIILINTSLASRNHLMTTLRTTHHHITNYTESPDEQPTTTL